MVEYGRDAESAKSFSWTDRIVYAFMELCVAIYKPIEFKCKVLYIKLIINRNLKKNPEYYDRSSDKVWYHLEPMFVISALSIDKTRINEYTLKRMWAQNNSFLLSTTDIVSGPSFTRTTGHILYEQDEHIFAGGLYSQRQTKLELSESDNKPFDYYVWQFKDFELKECLTEAINLGFKIDIDKTSLSEQELGSIYAEIEKVKEIIGEEYPEKVLW